MTGQVDNRINDSTLMGHPKAVVAGGMRVKTLGEHHPVKPASRMGVSEKVKAEERARKKSESDGKEEDDSIVQSQQSKPSSKPHVQTIPIAKTPRVSQTTMTINQPR